MTGWQMAMELYHVAPTPLAQRVPMNDTTGMRRDPVPVSPDELREWKQMWADGMSMREIAMLAGRAHSVIRRAMARDIEDE